MRKFTRPPALRGTTAQLVNELAEAATQRQLSRIVSRYGRLDLLLLDEPGYVQIDRHGAELLFQIITEREEKASIAIATNLPFSEWGTVFPDPRLVAAIADRVTFNACILETGTQSWRARSGYRPGPLGLGMIKASLAYWGACADAGLDQVIDDVWLVPDQPAGLQDALLMANTIWVGVHCPLAVAEQRERARGDYPVGAARGHHRLVHTFKKYDVDVDTSIGTARECAEAILATADTRS
jgi:chloramphenicol 3-O-phosphotransferase